MYNGVLRVSCSLTPALVTLCCYTCNDFRRAQQTPSHQQIVVDNACWGYDLGDVFSVV